MMGVLSWLGA